MASKLKDLDITKVDFVNAGANQQADILLFKNKDGIAEEETKKRLEHKSVFKKLFESLLSVAKKEGVNQAEIEAIMKDSDAGTFDDKLQLSDTVNEIWDFCYFLSDSFCSIVKDNDIESEDKLKLLQKSLSEFNNAVSAALSNWATLLPAKALKEDRNLTAEQLDLAKQRLAELIEKSTGMHKAETNQAEHTSKNTKGVDKEMKIDKSKLTPEELATLEAIEKKAGTEEKPLPETTVSTEKSTAQVTKQTPNAPTDNQKADNDDIYKGLHPAVAAELKELRKRADMAEDREVTEVAKKYEILGKKPEDLCKTLKVLKAAGGSAYDDMIGVLDASVAAIEKSGAFSEIGKSGNGGTAEPWSQIEKHAEDIQKSVPTLTWNQALEKACEQHPELVAEYEKDRQGERS